VIIFSVLVALGAYEFLLVVCTSAKLLGYGNAFDRWRGPVSRTTIRVANLPTDVYISRRSRLPVLLVHGVNQTGKDSAELKPVAEALAGSGFQVYAPDFTRLKSQNVTPADIDDVRSILQALRSDVGLFCASYGCGPALIAASLPELRGKVRFVMTYGAYFDLTDTLKSVITAPPNPLAYDKWCYMAANLDLVNDERDKATLLRLANERQHISAEEWTLDREDLAVEGRAMLALFESQNGKEFYERLNAVPRLKDRITRLSPSRYFDGIKANLIIVHMASDPAIPSSESVRMADAAEVRGIPHSLTILNMYGHTKPSGPPFGVRSVFAFYVPEGFKVLRVVNRVLSYAEGPIKEGEHESQ
jgi:acetyl esterase/lipase